MAITWRTVAGGGGGSGVSLSQSGTNNLMQAMDGLRRLAAEQQQMNIQNDQLITQKNTDDYLDQVAQVTSAADLSNPETQQQLMALRQGFGQMIDRNATRNAIQDRQLSLIKAETAQNEFNDQTQQREQRPLMEEAIRLSRSGDLAGANQILEDNSFINEGALAGQIDQNADRVSQRLYAAENQARAARNEARADRSEARQKAQFEATMSDRQEARQLRKDSNFLQAAELELKAGEAALRASNPLANTSTDVIKDSNDLVGKVSEEITPWFTDNDSARQQLTNRFQALMKDGVNLGGDIGTVKIPPALLSQYLDQAKGKVFATTGGWGETKEAGKETGGLLGDLNDWLKTYASVNPGVFRHASAVDSEIQKLREASKEVNAGKLSVLRGNKLDTTGLSDTIQIIRNRIPTDNR